MAADPRTLRIEFATEESFAGEFKSNIANGGIFIATRSDYQVRDAVVVEICLGYSGGRISLEGEVVHRVPPEMAETGATPGVAVQFTKSARDLRADFDRLADVGQLVDERASGIGRRVAPRTTARVAVRIEANALEIEGRTRNLSTTGVLIQVEGKPIEVGQPVTIRLTHPTTGEKMTIPSRVARHLSDKSGAVTGIALQFEPPEDALADLECFISEVKAAEHSRRLGGINGSISELGIENLLQMFGKCSPQGTLTVTNGSEEGEVVFESGLLRRVRLADRMGQEALTQLLAWRDGSFEFQARIDDHLFDESPLPLEAAILRALREFDKEAHGRDSHSDIELDEELESLVGDFQHDPPAEASDLELPEDAVLRVDHAAADDARDDLEKTEEAILDLAMVGMCVGKVISVIPEPAADVRAALEALVRRGVILLDR